MTCLRLVFLVATFLSMHAVCRKHTLGERMLRAHDLCPPMVCLCAVGQEPR